MNNSEYLLFVYYISSIPVTDLIFSSEKTAAEVKKIQDIKKELTKLDSELASDVALLRKQIELASVNYMETQ